jgi:hypothetical protein
MEDLLFSAIGAANLEAAWRWYEALLGRLADVLVTTMR